MEILVYSNRKTDPIYWDISTPEQRATAFLDLFRILRDEWDVYAQINRSSLREQALFEQAGQGDGRAAERLLTLRKNDEYESWHIADTRTPKPFIRMTKDPNA